MCAFHGSSLWSLQEDEPKLDGRSQYNWFSVSIKKTDCLLGELLIQCHTIVLLSLQCMLQVCLKQ
jgi:hypothetical protein